MFRNTSSDRPVSRARWAAIGAAVAVCLGAGGIGVVNATTGSGERAVYKPIDPCRMVDTRPGPDNVGGRTSPLGPAETYTLNAWGAIGDCDGDDLPDGITALALNVTAFNPTTNTFVTLFPAGGGLPLASHLNPGPSVDRPLPNAVNVDLNATGDFSVYNNAGSIDLIVDVVGVYDDHHHDDRYYPRGDVDAALATKANDSDVDAALATKADAADVDADNLWAVAESDGTLVRSSNVVGTELIGLGTGVSVTFNRDVSQCAYVATVGSVGTETSQAGFAPVKQRAGDVDTVEVITRNASGAETLRPFHLIVQC